MDDMVFDPTQKKKKKKTKKTLALDDDTGDNSPAAAVAAEEPTPNSTHSAATAPEPTGDEEPLSFDGKKKKKKKKKRDFDPEEATETTPSTNDTATIEDSNASGDVPMNTAADDFDFVLPLRKKRRRAPVDMAEEESGVVVGLEQNTSVSSEVSAWENTDRDYEYKELLQRVFDIMRKKNPDMVVGEKRRFVMKPPQVVRIGTKKSAFVNFTEICKLLHRQTDHVLGFVLAELGTSGSIDGSNQLVLKGRYQQKQMESVLRRYIREYVTCHTCKSPDTLLVKENRLFFLQCESCQSRCSVASIRSGFQAVTGKRSQMRAKAAA